MAKKRISAAFGMNAAAAGSLAAAILSALLWHFCGRAFYGLMITFVTISYHLWMRLGVGAAFNRLMGNRARYQAGWYQLRRWERRLYQLLGLRRWKGKLPTYDPAAFRQPSLEGLAMVMCQAELVHEVSALLSFCPPLLALWAGDLPVFLATSLLAAAFDLTLAAVQRYNRARIVRILERRGR